MDIVDIDRQLPRCPGVTQRDRQTLLLVSCEQSRTRPALHAGSELPGQIERVLEAGVHPEATGGRKQVHGIAGEKDSPVLKPLRDKGGACGPRLMADDVDADRRTRALVQNATHRCIVGRLVRSRGFRPQQEFISAIDRNHRRSHLGVDRPVLPGQSRLHQPPELGRPDVGREHTSPEVSLLQRPLAPESDSKRPSDKATSTVAPHDVAGTPKLVFAGV